MCDFGLVLGLASGIAGVAGEQAASSQNMAMANQNARLEHAAQEREFLVEADAANKDAYQAYLEGDRGRSFAKTAGNGMYGTTMAERGAEQQRQAALSIENAKDRRDAASANYRMQGKNTQIATQNQIETLKVNPMTSFINVATAGLQNYGAFK